MMSSSSGCSSGSPPLMVITDVPSVASLSMRRNIVVGRHGLGEIVEFVAVRAGQIAAPDRNDVDQQRMVGGRETLHDHLRAAEVSLNRFEAALPCCGCGWHASSHLLDHTAQAGCGAGSVFGGNSVLNGRQGRSRRPRLVRVALHPTSSCPESRRTPTARSSHPLFTRT